MPRILGSEPTVREAERVQVYWADQQWQAIAAACGEKVVDYVCITCGVVSMRQVPLHSPLKVYLCKACSGTPFSWMATSPEMLADLPSAEAWLAEHEAGREDREPSGWD